MSWFPGVAAAAWDPLGRALLDYHSGATLAQIVVHSDLWQDEPTPVAEFYRPEGQALPEIEVRALGLCRGRVLDLGAGAGRHALDLQRQGLEVVALDVAREAVQVMRERGVLDARCGDLDTVADDRFDTLLMLMHGIGLVGNLPGLAHFFEHALRRLTEDGQILCDSADLELVMNREDGELAVERGDNDRYLGEVEFRLSYGRFRGEPYPWLFVDPRTLSRVAEAAGLRSEVVARGTRGAYLACLIRR